MKKKLKPFDKYELYFRSVQDPPATIRFIERAYRAVSKKTGVVFAEDFCGTFALSCEFAKRSRTGIAIAIDRDPEPIAYGRKHYLSELSEDSQKRVKIVRADVLSKRLPKSDIIAAMNFSYFIFKERKVLKRYFERCYQRLNKKGLLVLDCFGGSEILYPNEDVVRYPGFKYYWDQVSFNPITHDAGFYIHFKRPGEKRRERAFSYDWRMWTLPELRDLLEEVGFKKVEVYWEGDNPKNKHESVFKRTVREENAPAWLAYVTAAK